MSRLNTAKKSALMLQKKKLEEQLKLCEIQIVEAKHKPIKTNLEFDESSDSDSDLSLPLDTGPSVFNLKVEHSTLETCLNATQELTGLQVLESEVNVLTDDPVFERERPVTEAGIWKEVTAECRVDLVTFTISFYVHKPTQLFGPLSYRSLQVGASKSAHEKELSKSILADITRPSDAFEVIKSYASANRSRRTTLAWLAEKYGENLFMMPKADGGYKLKCTNLLEISWTLLNKSSSIAPFKHQMTFDLEYKNESLLKAITQANKQLCNPSIVTEERTSLLSTIISTCLEAQDLCQQSSTDNESETARSQKRSNNFVVEEPDTKKRKDAEVMAPPKALPKKIKPRGKENNTNKHEVNKKKVNEKQAEIGKAKTVNQKHNGATTKVINKNKMADKHNDKEAAASNKVPSAVGKVKKIDESNKKFVNKKNIATNKTSNEKGKENLFTSKNKDLLKNNSTQNTEKSKTNCDGNTDKNKAKLLNVRGLKNNRLVKHGNNNAGDVNLQKTKIPQSVNMETKKNPKNLMRTGPKKMTGLQPSLNNIQSCGSDTNRHRGNIPRLMKKTPSKTK